MIGHLPLVFGLNFFPRMPVIDIQKGPFSFMLKDLSLNKPTVLFSSEFILNILFTRSGCKSAHDGYGAYSGEKKTEANGMGD